MLIGIDASKIGVKGKTGVEEYATQILRYLIKNDRTNRYILYAPHDISPALDKLPDNFSLKIISAPFFWTQIRLAWQIWKDHLDLFFTPSYAPPVFCFVPHIAVIHDVAFRLFPENYTLLQRMILEITTRLAIGRAKKIITISQTTKNDLVHLFRAQSLKIEVTYLGFDDTMIKWRHFDKNVWENISEKFNIKKPYLLFVGRIEGKKNLGNLLQAFYNLLAEGQDLQMILAGKDGVGADEVRAVAAKYNLDDKVIFTGYISEEEKKYLLSRCLCFTFVPKYEGFGIPVLEAMAMNIPVVASDIPVFHELYRDAVILTKPEDPDAIAYGIKSLLDDPERIKILKERGKKMVKDFSWDYCGEKILSIINEATKDKNDRRI
ncbi:glycosyltransferase family 4 protein [Candidatus Microgenomates bacterium]|nr:glycosyltransferase family 4 protein [Candidatus Microgenomates bacterium]